MCYYQLVCFKMETVVHPVLLSSHSSSLSASEGCGLSAGPQSSVLARPGPPLKARAEDRAQLPQAVIPLRSAGLRPSQVTSTLLLLPPTLHLRSSGQVPLHTPTKNPGNPSAADGDSSRDASPRHTLTSQPSLTCLSPRWPSPPGLTRPAPHPPPLLALSVSQIPFPPPAPLLSVSPQGYPTPSRSQTASLAPPTHWLLQFTPASCTWFLFLSQGPHLSVKGEIEWSWGNTRPSMHWLQGTHATLRSADD